VPLRPRAPDQGLPSRRAARPGDVDALQQHRQLVRVHLHAAHLGLHGSGVKVMPVPSLHEVEFHPRVHTKQRHHRFRRLRKRRLAAQRVHGERRPTSFQSSNERAVAWLVAT